ncbi:glycoside hydrolase family 127 protein [Gaoshiqia sediminis]|uniref:Glycoside hydrolase family 127 protein n=1 Tax=Gaoshiqia sediminis TaxID=2986998 RepID=A0AA42C9H0_9BACT|nr:glycoside hydrolase family 127 protein [Gaoshiqia sediminis]MCW0482462.1 glycoside hydrolase family 127 protein [Gaoshiqia sediminis]
MKRQNLIPILLAGLFFSCAQPKTDESATTADYRIKGVPFNEVHLSDQFWSSKIETNRTATIPASFAKCEEMGRMDNFLIAGGMMEGTTKGEMPFDDTDVYKIIEGAAYSLTTTPDPVLDAYVDSVIALIAIGQEEDGYLTTWKTIDPTQSPASWCPPGDRWEGLASSHELYNSGHLFEAAAAHYHATGKTNLLDIATKNADLLVSVFGKEDNNQVPGHQIVETGLIKLYLITRKQAYLDLARHFLDIRGESTKRELWGPYNQDHLPVTQQEEAVGHAVRAAYMYAGMTDIAALYNDSAYKNAVDKIWENVVFKKLYLTGGIGSRHDGEAFGENYELPNLTAYNETCAAIANVYWNYRMFLLHGDSKYIDVLERSLYNGVISGVALDGTSFFYPNPLECDMHYHFNSGGSLTREPWFDCSCCPSNLCRFMPSVPGYIYAQTDEKVYVNLFIQSATNLKVTGTSVALAQQTAYPWNGDVKIDVSPEREAAFALHLRIPGWAQNQPVPGNLYRYEGETSSPVTIKVNGEAVDVVNENGYAVLNRSWKKGDVVEYSLPMEIRKVKANELVEENRGKVAIERGPVVYCVEGADNADVDQLSISSETSFAASYRPELLSGVEVISASNSSGDAFTAIPYYVWNNRGANKMKVWLPEK